MAFYRLNLELGKSQGPRCSLFNACLCSRKHGMFWLVIFRFQGLFCNKSYYYYYYALWLFGYFWFAILHLIKDPIMCYEIFCNTRNLFWSGYKVCLTNHTKDPETASIFRWNAMHVPIKKYACHHIFLKHVDIVTEILSWQAILKRWSFSWFYFGLSPPPRMPVTTRIMIYF